MILSVTGHRPSTAYGGQAHTFPPTDRVLYHLQNLARHHIKLLEFAPAGLDRVLIGMALGWDTAVALVCVERGIPFTAVLPFPNQETKWEAYDQLRFQRLLKQADAIRLTADKPSSNEQERESAYTLARHWRVDNSDRLLALWKPRIKQGDTYLTVQYALARRRRVTNVWHELRHDVLEAPLPHARWLELKA